MRSLYVTILASLFAFCHQIHAFQICLSEPLTAAQVEESLETFRQNSLEAASQICATEEHLFENTVQPWYEMWINYRAFRQALQQTPDMLIAIEELDYYFSSIAHHPDLLKIVVSTADQLYTSSSLDLSQREMVEEILGIKHAEIDLLRAALVALRKSAPLIAAVQEMMLCGGKAEVSVEQDSDGNTSFDAGVSISTETDNGTFSAGVSGGVSRDSSGNVDANVKMSGSISW